MSLFLSCVRPGFVEIVFCSVGGKAAGGLAPTPLWVQIAPHTPGHSSVPVAPASPTLSPQSSGRPEPPSAFGSGRTHLPLRKGPSPPAPAPPPWAPCSPPLLTSHALPASRWALCPCHPSSWPCAPGICSVNRWDKGHQNLAWPTGPCRGVAAQRGSGGGRDAVSHNV